MGVHLVASFVLRGVSELVFDDQFGIKQQFDGVVEGGPADAKMLFVEQLVVQGFHVEMSFDGVDGIKYSVPFGCLAMSVFTQIFGKYLFYSIFDIFFLHIVNNANKVNPF